MGDDSIMPFLEYKNKFNFILTLTSNPGANRFEKLLTSDGTPLYMSVAKAAEKWSEAAQNVGLVVGATQDEMIQLRTAIPTLPFLIPGENSPWINRFPASIFEFSVTFYLVNIRLGFKIIFSFTVSITLDRLQKINMVRLGVKR